MRTSSSTVHSTSNTIKLHELQYTWVKPDLTATVSVVAQALCREPTGELWHDVEEHLDSGEFALSVYHNSKLIGFMIFTVPVENVLYIAGTMIRPEYQGLGIKALGTRLTMQVFPQTKYFAGRTQSPIVWSSVAKISDKILPHPSKHDPELELIQQEVARALKMSASLEQGFYGGPLYGEKPVHRNPDVQVWWNSFINFERGDAVLYLARFANGR